MKRLTKVLFRDDDGNVETLWAADLGGVSCSLNATSVMADVIDRFVRQILFGVLSEGAAGGVLGIQLVSHCTLA